MRYNKQELFALALQTSQNFDREGLIILKERQDFFDNLFRRSEGYTVRWFRLRGNLLFYLKGPEPWYEPLGVIVLGHHKVNLQPQDEHGHWPFQLVWNNGVCYRMATFSEAERDLWIGAMDSAPYETLIQRIAELQQQLNDTITPIDLNKYRATNKIINDFNEVPLCELALSFDNLPCNSNGKPPSPFAAVFVLFSEKGYCVRYGCTEVIQKCSNPNFSRTIMFRGSDGITSDVMIRILVYDMRETFTETGVAIGSVTMRLGHIQEAQRQRVPLLTVDNKNVGFVTFNGWSLESNSAASPTHIPNPEKNLIDLTPKILAHRRSQSLPSRMGLKLQYPAYPLLIRKNFVNPIQATYRFHSGLGGDIAVHESLAEPTFCFTIPLQLVEVFMNGHKELLEPMLEFANVNNRMAARNLDYVRSHLTIMRLLQSARLAQELVNMHFAALGELKMAKNMLLTQSIYFKPSIRKVDDITEDPGLAYVPVNLHLQRMWAQNESLNKKGFHDVITVGAFTAHTFKKQKAGGLLRLLQQSKDPSTCKAEQTANSNRLDADFEKIRVMKNLRNILVVFMDSVLLLVYKGLYWDVKKSMAGIRKCVKQILDMWNVDATEEAMSKSGWNKKLLDDETVELRRDSALALQALLNGPDGIARRLPLAASAVATVAALSATNIAHHADQIHTIRSVLHTAAGTRTTAGEVKKAGYSVSNSAVPKTASDKQDDAKKGTDTDPDTPKVADIPPVTKEMALLTLETAKLALTTKDVAKPSHANVLLEAAESIHFKKRTHSLFRTSSEFDFCFLGRDWLKKTPIAIRTYSESDLLKPSGRDDDIYISRTKRGKKEANNVTTVDKTVNEAPITSGSSAGNAMQCDQQAASSSSSSVAGHSGNAPSTSGSTSSFNTQTANSPKTSGNSNRKTRGCKNNRPPKQTKQERKKANNQLVHGEEPQSLDVTSTPASKVNMSVAFKSSFCLEHLAFNTTKKGGISKKNRHGLVMIDVDPIVREYNLNFFLSLTDSLIEMINRLFFNFNTIIYFSTVSPVEFEECRVMMDLVVKLVDEIIRWSKLAHSAMRIETESPTWSIEHQMLRTRRDICFSQALTAATAGLLTWATTTPEEIVVKLVTTGLGPLLEFEGLLSLYDLEKTMWGDMVIAVEDLHTVTFKFVQVTSSTPMTPQVTGSRSAVIVEIPVANSLYARFEEMNKLSSFAVTAVFFNIGINANDTLAEQIGSNKPQHQSNRDSLERISKYYHKYCQYFAQDPIERLRVSSRSKPLEEVMENLRAVIMKPSPKNVDVLQLAATATRLMHGVRFTSCKSAKDRTGMAVSLEQVNILRDEYHMAEDERKAALDVMRSEGCRRENTLKNIGKRKYNFHVDQIWALPQEYCPPLGTYGTNAGRNLD